MGKDLRPAGFSAAPNTVRDGRVSVAGARRARWLNEGVAAA
jgi:hypothetical protein